MEDQPSTFRGSRLVAALHGRRLWLTPDLRREIVGAMLESAEGDALRMTDPDFGSGPLSDRRAFARSVALERLANLYFVLGSRAPAFRALRDAALAALDGEAYDRGDEWLPARFLRIRFYALYERMLGCRASDVRLRCVAIDPRLLAEARRLGGEYL